MCSAKVLSQEDSKIVDSILKGVKKSSFLHFKCYNLAIFVAKFLKTFSTHHFEARSYGLIPKNLKKVQFMQFTLEMAVLECSFCKTNLKNFRVLNPSSNSGCLHFLSTFHLPRSHHCKLTITRSEKTYLILRHQDRSGTPT